MTDKGSRKRQTKIHLWFTITYSKPFTLIHTKNKTTDPPRYNNGSIPTNHESPNCNAILKRMELVADFRCNKCFYLYLQRTSINLHTLTRSDKLLFNAISCARFPHLHAYNLSSIFCLLYRNYPGGLSPAPRTQWLASSASNQMTPVVALHLFSQSQERNTVTPLTQWDVFIIIQ